MSVAGTIASYRYQGAHRVPSTTSQTAGRLAVAGAVGLLPVTLASPASADQLDEIAKCESGGNYHAQNKTSSASGKYQFVDRTWQAAGGSTRRAKDASPAEQDRIAARVFATQGSVPWNASRSCWSQRAGVAAPNRSAAGPRRAQAARPAPARPRAPRAEHRRQRPAQGSGVYTVRPGDTLSGIALAAGLHDWHQLWLHNRDHVPNPDVIHPGEHLTL